MKTLNPGILFIIKFLALFALFYGGTWFWMGLCAPGGLTYSSFAAKYLDYVTFLRSSILHGGNVAAHLLGLQSQVIPPFVLRIPGVSGVKMVYSCIGFGVMSFWAAFALANPGRLLRRLAWTFAGVFAIWFINCWRIALLLYLSANKGNINKFGEHHTVFNIISYIVVFIMMYFFTRSARQQQG